MKYIIFAVCLYFFTNFSFQIYFSAAENRKKPRGGEWSFKNSGSRKILVKFYESRSLVF